mgnify:CR=1 FL=1
MSKFHSLTIKDVRTETRDAVSIAFEIPQDLQDSFHFTQGQHLVMRTLMDGEEVRRSYSICTGTNDGELRVAIKRVDGGLFSNFANDQLKAGQTLQDLICLSAGFSHLDQQGCRQRERGRCFGNHRLKG